MDLSFSAAEKSILPIVKEDMPWYSFEAEYVLVENFLKLDPVSL